MHQAGLEPAKPKHLIYSQTPLPLGTLMQGTNYNKVPRPMLWLSRYTPGTLLILCTSTNFCASVRKGKAAFTDRGTHFRYILMTITNSEKGNPVVIRGFSSIFCRAFCVSKLTAYLLHFVYPSVNWCPTQFTDWAY